MSRFRRVVILSAATAVVAAAGSLSASVSLLRAAPAGAATAVDCSTGVIVAVDFSHWESGVTDAVCDTMLPANAAYALVATGFDPTPVSTYGLDFICQIAGAGAVEYPQGEDCSTTPPADAYWSFWYANRNQESWTYSNVGAMSLAPQAGSVEGWVFGGAAGGGQPSGFPTPNQVREATTQAVTGTGTGTGTTSTSTTGTTLASPGRSSGVSSGSNPAPASQGSTTGPATASNSAASTPTTPTAAPTHPALSPRPGQTAPTSGHASPSDHGPRASGSTSTSRPGDGERIVSAVPTVADRHLSSGPSTSFLLGAAVVIVLMAIGGIVAWARRRERPERL